MEKITPPVVETVGIWDNVGAKEFIILLWFLYLKKDYELSLWTSKSVAPSALWPLKVASFFSLIDAWLWIKQHYKFHIND